MSRTYIDLHTHSTASDGSNTPTELLLNAKMANVTTIALTDHDTVDGVQEAMAVGKEFDIEVIAGCELAVATELGEVHMLGLWLNPDAPKLTATMDDLRAHRTSRNLLIVEKLQQLGIAITYDEVLAIAGEGSVGRPHIAQVLINKGAVSGFSEAFHQYLADGARAHVPKKVLSPSEGVTLLKEEGATVSIAHLCIHNFPEEWIQDFLAELKPHGLDALEAYHSEHSPADTRRVVEYAHHHGLALTGGSDYHGAIKPKISLGRGKGSLFVPHSILDDLKALRRKQGLPV